MAPSHTWNDAGQGDDGGWKPDLVEDEGTWKPDHGDDTWAPDNTAVNGDFGETNVSKHAEDAEGNDGGCRYCHEVGHFARDCPNKVDRHNGCFNCGEEGHNKAECPNPAIEREFTGECRTCGEAGHRSKDCPQAPPEICKICKDEGHKAAACEANRMLVMFASMKLDVVDEEQAWAKLMAADKALSEDKTDMDLLEDVKVALWTYVKAVPSTTWKDLQIAFREAKCLVHFVAKEAALDSTFIVVNLQGDAGQEYIVSFEISEKPRRKAFADGWPSSPEENLERLEKAGIPLDGGIMKCRNCGELGHGSKLCTEERQEREAIVLFTCDNCGSESHRLRDCLEPRKVRGGCKNCGQPGHIAKECPEPPNLNNVECKNCSQMGHFSRDCPDREPDICRNCQQEGHRSKDCTNERVIKCKNCDELGHASRECPHPVDMSRVQCNNCDEMGHMGRGCPKPRDWSRVTCTQCGEKGHTFKKCTQAAGAGGDGGWDSAPAASADAGGGGGWDNAPASGGW